MRLAIHVLPKKLDVPGVAADQDGPQVEIDHLLADPGREGTIADAGQSIVGEDLDDQPTVKRKGLHRTLGLGERKQVHGVGAKVGRQRDCLALPFDNSSANLFDFHRSPTPPKSGSSFHRFTDGDGQQNHQERNHMKRTGQHEDRPVSEAVV